MDAIIDIMKRGLPSDWESRRKKVLERDGYICGNCKRSGKYTNEVQLEVHHIVERKRGGTHELSNLRTLCNECHAAITYDQVAPTAYQGVSSRKNKFGSRKAHYWILILTGWWSFGLFNITYAMYKYGKSLDNSMGLVDILKIFGGYVEQKTERMEDFTDNMLNGCPICGYPSTSIEKIIPSTVLTCDSCNAAFKKKGLSKSIVAQYTLISGDSEQVGETRKLTEWRKMGPEDNAENPYQEDN